MKKAKSLRKKSTSKKSDSGNPNHIFLVISKKYRVDEFPRKTKDHVYALIGAIRQLCEWHNMTYDAAERMTAGNCASVRRALLSVEFDIDSKIDYLNSILEAAHKADLAKDARRTAREKSPKPKKQTRRGPGRPPKSRK